MEIEKLQEQVQKHEEEQKQRWIADINLSNANNAYSLFLYGVRWPVTRDYYLRRLRIFNYIKLLPDETMEKRCNFFGDYAVNNPSLVFKNIIEFLQFQRERDIVQKATGTHTGNLEQGHLHFRNPTPDNNHSGTHGGSFTWDIFCDLSLEELGELQNKRYYTEKSTGAIKDATGQRVAYDHRPKRVETTKDR